MNKAATPRPKTRLALLLAASALLLVGLYWASLATAGVYPFGPASNLTGDLRYQYVDFFAWWHGVLTGEKNILYSGSQSLGMGTWGLVAYYLSSPCSLLAAFFDQEHMPDFVFLTTSLKLAAIQASATWYLRRRFDLHPAAAVALALGYSFGGWMSEYLRDLMWLDAFYLLPLLAFGLYRVANGRGWGLACAAMAADVVLCWYMAYMSLIFAVLVLAVELHLARRSGVLASAGEAADAAIRAAAALGLGAVLASWTLLPAVVNQLGALRGHWSQPLAALLLALGAVCLVLLSRESYPNAVRVLFVVVLAATFATALALGWRVAAAGDVLYPENTFFMLTPDQSGAYLLPGLWHASMRHRVDAGSLAFLLCFVLLFERSLPLRTKLVACAFAGVIFLSLWLAPLHTLWCGLRFPHGHFPRMGGFAAFCFVYLGALALQGLALEQRTPPHRALAKGSAACALLATVLFACGVFPGLGSFALVLASIALCALFVLAVLHADQAQSLATAAAASAPAPSSVAATVSAAKPASAATPSPTPAAASAPWASLQLLARTTLAALLACICLELGHGALEVWDKTGVLDGYTHESYVSYTRASAAQVNELRTADQDFARGLCRFDKLHTRYGLSAVNEGLPGGFSQLASYASTANPRPVLMLQQLGYAHLNEIQANIQGFAPVSDSMLGLKYLSSSKLLPPYEKQEFGCTEAGDAIWKNPWALPFGYLVSDSMVGAEFPDEMRHPFDAQNSFLSAALGRQTKAFKPLDVKGWRVGKRKTWSTRVPEGQVGFVYVQGWESMLSVDGSDQLYVKNPWRDAISVMVAGQRVEGGHTASLEDRKGPYTNIREEALHSFAETHCVFYGLDMEVFEQSMAELAQHPFEPDVYEDGRIEGNFTSPRDGYLLLTVARDSGWTLHVNGAEVQPKGAYWRALTLIPVQKGENRIEMRYFTPGLVQGAVVSLVVLAALALRGLLVRRKASRQTSAA